MNTASAYRQQVADNIRAEMARRRATTETLAEILGISKQAVSRRLTYATAFDADQILQIADFLNVEPMRLLGATSTNGLSSCTPLIAGDTPGISPTPAGRIPENLAERTLVDSETSAKAHGPSRGSWSTIRGVAA